MARAAAAFPEAFLDRAAEHVTVAIELAPNRAWPHRIRGLIFLANGQPDAAANALDEALKANEPARRICRHIWIEANRASSLVTPDGVVGRPDVSETKEASAGENKDGLSTEKPAPAYPRTDSARNSRSR
jgi:hypothetical protein